MASLCINRALIQPKSHLNIFVLSSRSTLGAKIANALVTSSTYSPPASFFQSVQRQSYFHTLPLGQRLEQISYSLSKPSPRSNSFRFGTCIHISKKHPSKQFSSSSSGGDCDGQITKLPRRLVKRLEKQGISEQEFVSRLKATPEFPSQYIAKADVEESETEHTRFVENRDQLEQLLKTMTTEPKFLSQEDSFPSDMKKLKDYQKQQGSNSSDIRLKMSPSMTSVVLFPGQGSQFVGMGQKLVHYPGVKELFEEASAVVGYDLLKLCLHGPKSELDKTVHCQPAVMITSLAAIEKFREEHPQAIENCVATAGFSVGEFAALVFSGVLSFPDAVKVVKIRAEAMQKASERTSSAMLTVFLAHDSRLKDAIKMAKEFCIERRDIADPVCTVANFLFPECKVLAGHEEAIEFIATNAKEFRLLRTKRLSVSGAFHTKLMQSAVQPLQQIMANMQLAPPKIQVYSNMTGAPYHAKANYPHLLGQQLVKPVRWEQILHTIYGRPQGVEFPRTYEMGPGKQMGTLLRQVNAQAYKHYHHIDV
ncbi:malonyl coa-acyl carrier protein transacylase [Plakobranchus ocellatus]|uniref:[acyl-carrier-protein] S-malonyltransferase n=1 Tax=Plakobranchus ocellatus TaxID=259542 RepID=A0AAV3ZMH7_9GAST|nr:malonyl coa-acyl carrier protein transacylase [Plakobranchus ocellatus]